MWSKKFLINHHFNMKIYLIKHHFNISTILQRGRKTNAPTCYIDMHYIIINNKMFTDSSREIDIALPRDNIYTYRKQMTRFSLLFYKVRR